MICMTVRQDGEDILVYRFGTMREAAEIFDFIADLMPGAQFIIEPLRH
jgi:hypothetical protein